MFRCAPDYVPRKSKLHVLLREILKGIIIEMALPWAFPDRYRMQEMLPRLRFSLSTGYSVPFSWHLSPLSYRMAFICFSCQSQIWIVFYDLPTYHQMRETCVVRGLLIILYEEHANRNKKREAEHYFYLQIFEGLPSESDIIHILLTSDSLTRT